jgi:hypothetical protein
MDANTMVRARFRLWLPEDLWVATVSRAFPDARLRLLTGVPLGERSLELGEVLTVDPRPVVRAIREHPDVLTLEPLHEGEDRALTRYETTDQRLYEFLGGPSVPPEFPLLVENGVMAFGVTTTQEGFERLGETLEASPLRFELRSVVRRDDDESLLTPRQHESLMVANRLGYFEVPREATLAEVAAALDVDKSTASELIRRGSARVLEQFLAEERRRW